MRPSPTTLPETRPLSPCTPLSFPIQYLSVHVQDLMNVWMVPPLFFLFLDFMFPSKSCKVSESKVGFFPPVLFTAHYSCSINMTEWMKKHLLLIPPLYVKSNLIVGWFFFCIKFTTRIHSPSLKRFHSWTNVVSSEYNSYHIPFLKYCYTQDIIIFYAYKINLVPFSNLAVTLRLLLN